MKKTTSELLESMKNSRDYSSYLHENKDEISQSYMKIDRALSVLLTEKKLKKAEVIAKSGIEVHYAYQIFSGVKTPTRDKVLMLCIGMALTVEETQQLLKISGYPPLYSRNGRDNAVLFGLVHSYSVIDINTALYDGGYEILM